MVICLALNWLTKVFALCAGICVFFNRASTLVIMLLKEMSALVSKSYLRTKAMRCLKKRRKSVSQRKCGGTLLAYEQGVVGGG